MKKWMLLIPSLLTIGLMPMVGITSCSNPDKPTPPIPPQPVVMPKYVESKDTVHGTASGDYLEIRKYIDDVNSIVNFKFHLISEKHEDCKLPDNAQLTVELPHSQTGAFIELYSTIIQVDEQGVFNLQVKINFNGSEPVSFASILCKPKFYVTLEDGTKTELGLWCPMYSEQGVFMCVRWIIEPTMDDVIEPDNKLINYALDIQRMRVVWNQQQANYFTLNKYWPETISSDQFTFKLTSTTAYVIPESYSNFFTFVQDSNKTKFGFTYWVIPETSIESKIQCSITIKFKSLISESKNWEKTFYGYHCDG